MGRGDAGRMEKTGEAIMPQHFAFRCDAGDILNKSNEYLAARNLPAYNFLRQPGNQPMVFARMPAIAVYFNEPDGHILEFIAMLPGKPSPGLGVITYEEWCSLTANGQ